MSRDFRALIAKDVLYTAITTVPFYCIASIMMAEIAALTNEYCWGDSSKGIKRRIYETVIAMINIRWVEAMTADM